MRVLIADAPQDPAPAFPCLDPRFSRPGTNLLHYRRYLFAQFHCTDLSSGRAPVALRDPFHHWEHVDTPSFLAPSTTINLLSELIKSPVDLIARTAHQSLIVRTVIEKFESFRT